MIMTKKEKTADAVRILHGRYVKGDPERKASVESQRVNAEVARLIYDLRKEAGLSQQELAELIGTTQSVISRLEDADYNGHSLTMLNRIAKSLNQRLMVTMTAADPAIGTLLYAFHSVLHGLRRARGLTIDDLATRIDVDADELRALERGLQTRPQPRTIFKLSQFYGVSNQRMLELAGAVREVPDEVRQQASRFAAKSDSFAKLSQEERRMLDEFVKFLKSDG
jgi:transcriptional regulator with XRE-family HTH domain